MARGETLEVGVQQAVENSAAVPSPNATSSSLNSGDNVNINSVGIVGSLSPMAAEQERICRRSRVRHALLDEEPPLAVPELQWWQEPGRGLEALCDSMMESLEEIIYDDIDLENENELSRTMQRACMWFQHVVCAEAIVKNLPVNTGWTESSSFCNSHIRAVTAREPQRVCSRAFRAGDIVWNCKQCQMDSTCVLCQDCFRDSDHDGHDVYFYHVMTDAGGCCDCGDPGAWDPQGFCSKHGEFNVPEPKDWLPASLESAVRILLKRVVNLMAHFASNGRADLILEPKLDALKAGAVFTASPYREELARISECLTFAVAPHAPLRPREPREEMSVPVLINNWFRNVEKEVAKAATSGESPTIEPFVFAAVMRDNVGFCRDFAEQMNDMAFFKMSVRNSVSLACSVAIEVMSSWIRNLCSESDSFSRLTARALTEATPVSAEEEADVANTELQCSLRPLKDLIVYDLSLPGTTSKSLRAVYIRLLVDSLFKKRFAVAFAKMYRSCCATRVNELPVLELTDTDIIFGLSVQFLNRPKHVLELVRDYGFLESIMYSLESTVKHCQQESPSGGNPELDLLSPVLTHRKTKCVVTDLTYVLNAPSMSLRLLAAQPRALSTLFDLFDLLYSLHPQTRVCAPDLPIRDERWIPAFNLSLSVHSLFVDLTRYFTFGLKNTSSSVTKNSANDASSMSLPDVLESLNFRGNIPESSTHEVVSCQIVQDCAELTARILERHAPAAQVIGFTENLLGRLPYIPCNVSKDPVTFHCALQRFFSLVFHQAIASSLQEDGYSALLDRASAGFWLGLLRQPLTAVILSAQSAASMWLRNEDMASQSMNYQALPFVSGFFMDLRVLQAAALELPGTTFVNYLINGYNMARFFSIDRAEDPPAPEEYQGQLAEHLLETICRVVTELPCPTPAALERMGYSNEDILSASDLQLRREIVHLLAIRSSSFSTINDTCTHLRQVGMQTGAHHLKRVLHQVAQTSGYGDGLRPVEYRLKPESWLEFDPLFHRLSRHDKSQAREHSQTFRPKEEVEKPCFPGDSKPRGEQTRRKPLPPAPWHTFIHPAYGQVRTKVLLCDATFLLLHRAMVRAVLGKDVQCGVLFLANAIQLLSLQVHLVQELIEFSNAEATRAGDGSGDFDMRLQASDGAVHPPVSASVGIPAGLHSANSTPGSDNAMDSDNVSPSGAFQIGTELPWARSCLSKARASIPAEFYNEASLSLPPSENGSTPLPSPTAASSARRAQPDVTSYIWLPNESDEIKAAKAAASMLAANISRNASGNSSSVSGVDVEDGGEQLPPPDIGASYAAKIMCKVENSNFTILDCLLKLWHDDLALDEVTRDGVRWILTQLNQLDQTCHKRIRAEFKSRKSESVSEKEKQSRKRKAQRLAQLAQRQAMSAMKQSQAKAAELFADEFAGGGSDAGIDDDIIGDDRAATGALSREKKHRSGELDLEDFDDDDEGFAGAEATTRGGAAGAKQRQAWLGPNCVACHERKSLDEEATCYIGFYHRNDVLVTQREETTAQGWCVSWPAGPPNRSILQLCGHAIHEHCLTSFRAASASESARNGALWINSKRHEFLCPLCKTLSNFVVPCVPEDILHGSEGLALNPPPPVPLSTAASWFSQFDDVDEGDVDSVGMEVQDSLADRDRDESRSDLILAAPMSPRSAPGGTTTRRRGFSTNSWHGGSPIRSRSNLPAFVVKDRHGALDPLIPAISAMCDALSQNEIAQSSPRSRRMSEKFAAQMIASTPTSAAEKMALLDQLVGHTSRDEKILETPAIQRFTSLCFSFALTVISEQRARAEGGIMPPGRIEKMSYLFRACRAALLANAGAGLHALQSVLQESVSSTSREMRHHCVLNQSPELILVLSCLFDPSPQSCWTAIHALYCLKLAQSLLEGEVIDRPSSEDIPSQISSAKGALELSRVMLGKFERMSELTSPRAVQTSKYLQQLKSGAKADSEQEKIDAHLTMLATSHVMEFLQLAQVMLEVASDNPTKEPLELMQWPSSGVGAGALTLNGVEMPMSAEVLESTEMMQQISSWLDQVLACAPGWAPRPRMQPPPISSALRPLSVRKLINLRHSYTEQYVEVKQALEEHDPSHDRAICLVCGHMMLAGKSSRGLRNRRQGARGECTRHTDETHDGVGVVLLFRRSSTVLLIHGAHAAYWGSLYVDKNGDDQQVVPSLPMYLDKNRFEKVEQLWAENRIPAQVASLRNTGQIVSGSSPGYQQVVIRADYY